MSTLHLRRLTPENLRDLVETAPHPGTVITTDQRGALAQRFAAVPTGVTRRLDAWSVEQAGEEPRPFVWSVATARRLLAASALRRMADGAQTPLSAVTREIDDLLLRYVSGDQRLGSLAHWLSGLRPAGVGVVQAAAVAWVIAQREVLTSLEGATLPPHDAYYSVAGARTTLRGRRDIVVPLDSERVVLRLRSGSPGRSAGAGLRTDLLIDALADRNGRSAQRFIGVWPDAGLILGVDGTLEHLRSSGRDLVRCAVAQHRHAMVTAA